VERNVNLDHHIPSASLLSYSEYHKVPKSEEAQLHKKDYLEYRDFLPDDSGLSIWDRLRKPEFQRATNGWEDEKIVNLIKTLRENQVIPGVILWLNTETGHIFVLDGAHRLSTVRAWITDDWGGSPAAAAYGYVEDGDVEAAGRARLKIDEEIGSFEAIREAGKRYRRIVDEGKKVSDFLDPDTESKGRFMYNLNTSLRIPIQWVSGDYKTAEHSFININTGGTPLSDSEVLYLKNRRSPVARAMTGIVSNGSKPYLWLKYREECDKLSRSLYDVVLGPSDSPPAARVSDYPVCLVKKQKNFERYLFLQGIFCTVMLGGTGEDNLRAVMEDFANEASDEIVATKTLECLQRVKSAISSVHSNQSHSLGLYPAFYFYTNKGQYKDLLFLLFLSWSSQGTQEQILNRKIRFTLARDLFEEVWMMGKEAVFQCFGRKGAGPFRMTLRHVDMLQRLMDLTLDFKSKSKAAIDVLDEFLRDVDPKIHSDFLKQHEQEQGRPYGRFSEATKLHGEFLALFHGATHRCATCGGRVLLGSHQADHEKKRSDGGTSGIENLDIKHPFCNNNKDRLEGLRRCFGDSEVSIDEQLAQRAPIPTPDSEVMGQLDLFGFEQVKNKKRTRRAGTKTN
jgi:hypothetical protein